MRKRNICLIMAILLGLMLTACGGNSSAQTTAAQEKQEKTQEKTEPQEGEQTTAAQGNFVSDEHGFWDPSSGKPGIYTGRSDVLTLSYGQSGSGRDDDYMMVYYNCLTDIVSELTDGKIQFEIFPDNQLGTESDMLEQLVTGTLDAAPIGVNVLGTVYPEFYTYMLPFSFDNDTDYWEVCAYENSEFLNPLRRLTEEKGSIQFVTSYCPRPRGFQNNKHEVRTPGDCSDLMFRVMAGQLMSDTFSAIGMSTSTLSISEVYTGLQQGVIDGEDCSIDFASDKGFLELEKYATEINMFYSTNALVFSADTWKQLSPEEKVIISYAASEAEKTGYTDEKLSIHTYYKAAEDMGVKVIYNEELTDAERQSWLDAVAPMRESYAKIVGEDIYQIFNRCCGDARANGSDSVKWWK